MKRALALTAVLLMLLPLSACADGEQAYFQSLSVSTRVEYLNLGDQTVHDFVQFYLFLDQLPNLKKVDMFATGMTVDRCDEMAARYPGIEFGWTIC